MRKVGIDFDGVITEQIRFKEIGIDEFKYLKSNLSIFLSKPRVGTFQIISALYFFADL